MTTKAKIAETPQKTAKPRAARKSKPSTPKKAAQPHATDEPITKSPTKRDQLAVHLVRDEGATIDQMTATTGWLAHTVRAAMTGLKKLGYAIDSDKIDGLRTNRAVEPQ